MSIAKKLNPYLSDLVVMYLKLHDLHWKVKGKMFVQVHLYTEARYDDLAAKFDAVAELLIMGGEAPVSTIAQYLEQASIKELGQEKYSDSEVLDIITKDFEHLKAEAADIRAYAVEQDAFSAVAIMEEHIASYDKELWFLKSMME